MEENKPLDSAKDSLGNAADNIEEKGKQIVEKVDESLSDAADRGKEIIQADNKKVLVGILGILLGGLGIHKFVLGYTTEGIIQIVITVVTCGVGSIIGLIEGIIYLTKSDDEFYQTYQVNKRGWF